MEWPDAAPTARVHVWSLVDVWKYFNERDAWNQSFRYRRCQTLGESWGGLVCASAEGQHINSSLHESFYRVGEGINTPLAQAQSLLEHFTWSCFVQLHNRKFIHLNCTTQKATSKTRTNNCARDFPFPLGSFGGRLGRLVDFCDRSMTEPFVEKMFIASKCRKVGLFWPKISHCFR